MTKLLGKAFAKVAELPEAEQDKFAEWILAELESDRKWDAAFVRSQDLLARLADEALEEDRQGKTQPLPMHGVSAPHGVPGQQLQRFAGTIPLDDLELMREAIEQDCERGDDTGP